jgi:arylsulfatase A-like enzyme
MFVLAGQGIRAGHRLEGARIVDLAPTLLHLAGVPVPEDMDGQILSAALEPNSALAAREVRRQAPLGSQGAGETDEEYEEIVGSRLRDLGYL